jgi:hypothetical protein
MSGDMILDKGEHNHELIIMECGNATGLDGAITTNYPAGSFFGEMEFLGLAETSSVAIRAEEHCELFSLRYGDIAETLTEYPDVQEQLQEYAVMKKAAMNQLQGLPEGMTEPAYHIRNVQVALGFPLRWCLRLVSLTIMCVLNAGASASDKDALAEPHHDALALVERLKKCGRGSLEAVLLAAIVAKKIGVEDLRPNT